MTNFNALRVTCDLLIFLGYHWDCSDWVRRSQNPLPNITEVPGSEVPDSSSFHSNESNESRHHLMSGIGPIDPTRDIDTLNEDESEYVADSECEPCPVSPGLNALNDCGESFRFNTGKLKFRYKNKFDTKYLVIGYRSTLV